MVRVVQVTRLVVQPYYKLLHGSTERLRKVRHVVTVVASPFRISSATTMAVTAAATGAPTTAAAIEAPPVAAEIEGPATAAASRALIITAISRTADQ